MDFILGLPPTFEAGHFTIRIGAPLENASYIVETSTGQISSGTVTPDTGGGVAIVSPNISLQVTSNENIERMKGIRIRATGANPITVLVSVITTSDYQKVAARFLDEVMQGAICIVHTLPRYERLHNFV
jgi:hypothetical protein